MGTTEQQATERRGRLSRKKLRKLMLDADLLVKDVAELTGIDRTQVGHVLRGARDTETTLKAICEIICERLGKDPRELFPEYAHLWSPWAA